MYVNKLPAQFFVFFYDFYQDKQGHLRIDDCFITTVEYNFTRQEHEKIFDLPDEIELGAGLEPSQSETFQKIEDIINYDIDSARVPNQIAGHYVTPDVLCINERRATYQKISLKKP